MTIFDTYQLEPNSAFSGSYQDAVMYGTFFDRRANFNRVQVASKVSGISSGSYYSKENIYLYTEALYTVSGAFIGRVQRFQSLVSDTETVFDSVLPSPLNYSVLNGASPVLFNSPSSGSSLFGIPSVPVSSSAFIFVATADAVVSTSAGTRISDNLWLYNFPFASRYKNIQRYTQQSYKIPVPIPTSISWSNNLVAVDMASPGRVDRISLISFVSKSFTNANNPTAQAWTYDVLQVSGAINLGGAVGNDLDDTSVGLLENTNRHFFGVGLGIQGMTDKTHALLNFPSFLSIDLRLIFAPILRGFKYGIYNANPTRSKTVWRLGRYGQMRDMLEQRPVTKFIQEGTLFSPIQVTFVSSAAVFSQSRDYLTATNPSYNPRDSGMWDYEYRSGQPFFDIEEQL